MSEWFKDYFDEWYGELILDTIPAEMTQQQAMLLIRLLDLSPGKKVIDLGCGKGRHAILLSKAGCQVTALDFCSDYLEALQRQVSEDHLSINIINQDMRTWEEKNTYDGAYLMFTSFGYFSNEENEVIIHHIANSLKPKGKLLVDIENRDYILKFFIHEKWREKENGILLERHKFFPLTSLLTTKRMLVTQQGEKKESSRQYRLYSAHEIISIASQAGMILTDSYGDYSGIPFQINSPRIIFTFQKK